MLHKEVSIQHRRKPCYGREIHFQSVFGNSHRNPKHFSAWGREESLEQCSILWSDWPTSKQKVLCHRNHFAPLVRRHYFSEGEKRRPEMGLLFADCMKIWCVSFLHKVVFCLEQFFGSKRYVYRIIAHNRTTRTSRNLFIIQIRCTNPWIVLAEKGHQTKDVKRKWYIQKNNKEQVQFTTIQKAPWKWYKEKRKQEGGISVKNQKRHSPGYSSMSLTKQYFKPIHPYFSLPHLLAQFPVVNIIILSSITDSWIVNFTIWLVKFMPT